MTTQQVQQVIDAVFAGIEAATPNTVAKEAEVVLNKIADNPAVLQFAVDELAKVGL